MRRLVSARAIKFANVISVISFFVAVIGIVCFYTGNQTISVICAAFTIADSVFQTISGSQRNLNTEIFTAIVGLAVAFIARVPVLECVAVALCIGTAAVSLFGWICMLAQFIKFSRL